MAAVSAPFFPFCTAFPHLLSTSTQHDSSALLSQMISEKIRALDRIVGTLRASDEGVVKQVISLCRRQLAVGVGGLS
eukprot:1324502-Rhodomonas_salina.1